MTSEAWVLPDAEAWARRTLFQTLIGADARQKLEQGCMLSLLFADDAQLRDLNLRFRGKDKPTNVLSFPALALPRGQEVDVLGDIAFALETIRAEAVESGKPFSHYLTHLLVHGILHLIGHTHEGDDEAERMRVIEVAVLRTLGLPDPYAEPVHERQAGAA